MAGERIWNGMWTLVRLAIGLPLLAWALYLVWAGSDLLSFDDPHARMGGFTLLVSGLVWLAFDLVGFIYNFMKRRAPAKQTERPTEPAELTFDADAAIERYLAARKEEVSAGSTRGVAAATASSSRPVFGRRGSPA